MLRHPDYGQSKKPKPGQSEIGLPRCIRQGHESEDVVKGHIIPESTLQLLSNKNGRVVAFQTRYQPAGQARTYAPQAHASHTPIASAATIRGTCDICEQHFKSIDNLADASQQIDLTRAWHEACARNTHHALWLAQVFKARRDLPASEVDISGISPQQLQANKTIADAAYGYLPPQPPEPAKPGLPLESDAHFHHFDMLYPTTPFHAAVSTEVALVHESNPATATLGYVNSVPQKTQGAPGWHTAAALSVSRKADPVWQAILDNSRNFHELEHQLMISNLATKSPDGICFSPNHFSTLPWSTHIKPNLLENPFPGLNLSVVNITGNDLSCLTGRGFNIFAATRP